MRSRERSSAERGNVAGPRGNGRWLDRPRIRHAGIAALLLLQAVLAVTSLVGDSITFDETSHLTSGLSYWLTGDYRLAPEHPPLPKMWCALPLLFMDNHWVNDPPGWKDGVFWQVGVHWFSSAPNRDALLTAARCMMVAFLLATTLLIYRGAKRLWGEKGGLLALTVAALCPTLLAHGRLVTTDLPSAFFALLAIDRFAALSRGISPPRALTAALALAGLALSKFSWPLVLPALLVLAALGVFRSKPMPFTWSWRLPLASSTDVKTDRAIDSRARRFVVLTALSALVVMVVGISIWTCYGWRFSPYARDSTSAMESDSATDPAAWRAVLSDERGEPLRGPVAGMIRAMHTVRLLPEAYLYGLAYTLKTTGQRESYLMGKYHASGALAYFPIAFLIKTPIPTMILIAVALAALGRQKLLARIQPGLALGLAVFALTYALSAVCSNLNIGHRHLLPVYPPLLVLIGAAAGITGTRAGRLLVGGCVSALALIILFIHPHYLSYFNELVGGPSRGHLYLADSNIDWGQDLKRLRRYAADHPREEIKLAYFGMADPRTYGIDAAMLPSSWSFGSPAELTAGTYVISVTQQLGVYLPEARPEQERETRRRLVNALGARAQGPSAMGRPVAGNEAAAKEVQFLEACLLFSGLRRLEPQERIGWSMFVYRLTDADVAGLISPEESVR